MTKRYNLQVPDIKDHKQYIMNLMLQLFPNKINPIDVEYYSWTSFIINEEMLGMLKLCADEDRVSHWTINEV